MAVTAETVEQLERQARRPLFLRLRWKWWRVRTALRMRSPAFRAKWRAVFLFDPHLCNARHYLDYRVMSGFYNDTVPGGFMTTEQAEFIYNEVQR